jgi:hypothetical protein
VCQKAQGFPFLRRNYQIRQDKGHIIIGKSSFYSDISERRIHRILQIFYIPVCLAQRDLEMLCQRAAIGIPMLSYCLVKPHNPVYI